MQNLIEAATHHATTVGMQIDTSKTKVTSALIPGAKRQTVLLDDESMEDVEKVRYLGSMVIGNGQGIEEVRSRANLARSAFPCLQYRLCSRRAISLRTKDRVYQTVMR